LIFQRQGVVVVFLRFTGLDSPQKKNGTNAALSLEAGDGPKDFIDKPECAGFARGRPLL
jgi:hypothetical protein